LAGLTPPRPLAASDDRDSFDCGRDSLNQWFRRHAWRNQESGASRTSVVCDAVTVSIVGYVSLSAAQIEREYLPKAARRNRPSPIPVILLGQLAIDRQHHGKGYARSLIVFALMTAVRLSKDIGCFGVLTHTLDNDVRAFYRRFGFEDLPYDPNRSMIVRMIDLERNGF
jgi:GNAT superfamily N-acetyltransferase